MKTHHAKSSDNMKAIPVLLNTAPASDGRSPATIERPETSVPAPRRYPSFAGDNQPWHPPALTVRRSAMAALFPRDGEGISLVRALSLIAILGIVAALAAAS